MKLIGKPHVNPLKSTVWIAFDLWWVFFFIHFTDYYEYWNDFDLNSFTKYKSIRFNVHACMHQHEKSNKHTHWTIAKPCTYRIEINQYNYYHYWTRYTNVNRTHILCMHSKCYFFHLTLQQYVRSEYRTWDCI